MKKGVRRMLACILTFTMLLMTNCFAVSINDSSYNEPADKSESITIYNEALGKDVTYVKWNGNWAAVINTEEDLHKYVNANREDVAQAIEESVDEVDVSEDGAAEVNSATAKSYNKLVRRVKGTYNFDCRVAYTIMNNKVVKKKTYGCLTGITFGVRYDGKTATTKLVNKGKSIHCFISGTITNYIIFKDVGDVYTCSVTSGGTVKVL